MRRNGLWLCLPGVFFCAADGCLTLAGQPAEYWTGGHVRVLEGNPVAAWLLSVHPLAFAASAVPYLGLFVGAVLVLPRPWAAAIAVSVSASHAFGAAMWCVFLWPERWWPLASLGLAGGGLGALALRLGWRQPAPVVGSLSPLRQATTESWTSEAC